MKFSTTFSVSLAAGLTLAADMAPIGTKRVLENGALSSLNLLDTTAIPPFGPSVTTSAPAPTVEMTSTVAASSAANTPVRYALPYACAGCEGPFPSGWKIMKERQAQTSSEAVDSSSGSLLDWVNHAVDRSPGSLPVWMNDAIHKRQVHTQGGPGDSPVEPEPIKPITTSDSDFEQEVTVIARSAPVPTTFQTVTHGVILPTLVIDLKDEDNVKRDDKPDYVIRGGSIGEKLWIISDRSPEATPSPELEKRQGITCPPGVSCMPDKFYHGYGEKDGQDDGEFHGW